MCHLGRCGEVQPSHIKEFPVDGAGGELIETVEATIQNSDEKDDYDFLKRGILISFKESEQS